jgi:methylated-DNA-[protein]-cysteine S-methyltransferase
MKFKDRVLSVVADIPRGETLTYKQVAELAGSPRAYRAVGNVMKGNTNPHVPCHRVVKSDGGVGGYNGIGGLAEKEKLLKQEGAI